MPWLNISIHSVPPMPAIPGRLKFLILGAALAGALIFFRFTFLGRLTREPELPKIAKVPEFRLQNAAGEKTGLPDLLGRVWVAQFMFTRCAGTCPMMISEMKALRGKLPESVRLVSFSVDPEDGPRELSAYAAAKGADWIFLSGKGEAVRDLCVKGFKLAVADGGSAEEPILHSKSLVLIDGDGFIRGYYDSLESESLERLAKHASRLLSGA